MIVLIEADLPEDQLPNQRTLSEREGSFWLWVMFSHSLSLLITAPDERNP